MDAKELGNQPAAPVQGQPFYDDNGTPRNPYGYGWFMEPHSGLTKREMLAARAMQGVMYHADFANCGPQAVAEAAVELADALLAELAKVRP
jgi:hypothetical protein